MLLLEMCLGEDLKNKNDAAWAMCLNSLSLTYSEGSGALTFCRWHSGL